LTTRHIDTKKAPGRAPGAFYAAIKKSFEIAGATLDSLAFFAFGDILDLAVLENGLHFNFAAAGAIKMMRRGRGTRVFRNLCHDNSFYCGKQPRLEYSNRVEKSIHKKMPPDKEGYPAADTMEAA